MILSRFFPDAAAGSLTCRPRAAAPAPAPRRMSASISSRRAVPPPLRPPPTTPAAIGVPPQVCPDQLHLAPHVEFASMLCPKLGPSSMGDGEVRPMAATTVGRVAASRGGVAAGGATGGHRRCCIWRRVLLCAANDGATCSWRRCYKRRRVLLYTASVGATYGLRVCYMRPAPRYKILRRCYTPYTGSMPSSAETNGATCQQGDISHGAQYTREELGFKKLPEDIVHYIHSHLHVQDAARAACVSRVFLCSWRCYSDLMLSVRALGLAEKKYEEKETSLIDKVDKILKNHYSNGVKVKTLSLDLSDCKNINASYLDMWLEISVKSGTTELDLILHPIMDENYYSFPCSVLSDKAAASSIQTLFLASCVFQSTSTLGCLKRLKSLNLSMVHITEEGLGHFLSKCSALERLVVYGCSGIICLRIPWTLQQLKILHITTCKVIQMIVIDAPNLCTLYFDGGPLVEISVRNSSQLKDVSMWSDYLSAPGMLAYARARLPSITPNVESLTLRSYKENVDTPMLSSKLIHLKNLEIGVLGSSVEAFSPSYDVFSLVSFLDACPVLESFILWVEQDALRYNPAVVGNDEKYTSRKPECRHNSLRQVTIKGFCLAKSLVELTIHILESAPCLERLMLDTTRGCHRSSRFRALRGSGQCLPMTMTALAEAHKAVEFAGRYIAGRVPKGVEFQVIEPCSGCHTGDP